MIKISIKDTYWEDAGFPEETNTDNSCLAQNTMHYCSDVARIFGQHKLNAGFSRHAS